jgi:large subunit ribosomal protein L4
MAANVLTTEAAQKANILLTEGEKGHHAIYLSVIALQAARRAGTACTKTRGEVAGSGKKLWRQKGTGRARVGDGNAPHWRGGGVAWGPRPRDYSKKLNKKEGRLAFRSALTARINDGDVLVVPALKVADGKTKSFVKALRDITDAKKVLVVSSQFEDTTERSARNLPTVDLVSASSVNTENLLNYDKIVVTKDALETFAKRTAPIVRAPKQQ